MQISATNIVYTTSEEAVTYLKEFAHPRFSAALAGHSEHLSKQSTIFS